MGANEVIFLAAVAVLFAVPPYFVWKKVYDDGVFGRLGLSGIAFFAMLILFEALGSRIGHHFSPAIEVVTYETSGEVAYLVACFAIFLTWHLVRFHRRVVMHKSPPRPSAGKVSVP